MPHNTISTFLADVCEAIIVKYGEELVTLPQTQEEWLEVSDEIGLRCNFHTAIGAIDGKHIVIKAPVISGYIYNNYNCFFAITLVGIVDTDCKFLWVDVGTNGSALDCAVLNQSDLKTVLENNILGLPSPRPLPGDV